MSGRQQIHSFMSELLFNQPEVKLSNEEAIEFTERLFDVQVAACRDLAGYLDLNFLITNVRGERFVLKVMNAHDSENSLFLDQQNEAMRAVAEEGLGAQRPIRSRDGHMTELVTLATTGRQHAVRLLTFASGVTLEAPEVRIHPGLMHSIGARVAQIDRLLARTFAASAAPAREHLWSAWEAPKRSRLLDAVPELEDRELLLAVFRSCEEDLLPKMSAMTTGPIHSDANFANILVERTSKECSEFRLNSIIDFGDLHSSVLLYGLAVLCAYVMLSFVPEQWTIDICEYSTPKYCIAGYLSEYALPKEELALLPKFVALRYAQSLTIGAYSYHILTPDKESRLDTQKNGWRQLKHIWTANHDDLLSDWLSLVNV